MASAESWVVGTCRGRSKHVLGKVQTGLECVGNVLTVMLSFTLFTSVYLNNPKSVFMSAISQILIIRKCERTK